MSPPPAIRALPSSATILEEERTSSSFQVTRTSPRRAAQDFRFIEIT